jgi:hypothetical protein
MLSLYFGLYVFGLLEARVLNWTKNLSHCNTLAAGEVCTMANYGSSLNYTEYIKPKIKNDISLPI